MNEMNETMQMMQLMILQQGCEANRHVKKRTQSYLSPVDRLDSILEDNSCPAVTLDSMADVTGREKRDGMLFSNSR